jgi:threonine synthase
VSKIQESQFTTLGRNVTALEINGSFDDCQRLVKSAFSDVNLNSKISLTSANSINVARFLPQSFYYFNAYARLCRDVWKSSSDTCRVIFSVPSGNFGNLTAGLFAAQMGLPVKHFIAANNENDVVCDYLKTGSYKPRASVRTIANAMDVGDPSNFARILDLYGNSFSAISRDISGYHYSDDMIRRTIGEIFSRYGYLTDPHGACACQALSDYYDDHKELRNEKEIAGVFLETAHPAKFPDTVESVVGKGHIHVPERLKTFMSGKRKVTDLKADYNEFRDYLYEEVK